MASKTPRHHKLFYGSSYDRGLEHLLNMWPEIKEEVPDATLDICYGWDLFLAAYMNNEERMNWMDRMNTLMSHSGITQHGRVGKKKLREIRSKCGIWAYPTHFPEINCITALDAQSDGLVPVVMNFAALQETVGSGVKIEGDIYMYETTDLFKNALIELMKDKKLWEIESENAKKFARDYDWENIAKQWEVEFK